MNVGKKKVDWVMADGTKYTAKKAAALTRLAKREKKGGGSPGKKEKDEDEDEDDNNDGGAGSDGSGSSSSGNGGSSNGSSTVAAGATKVFVKMTASLPNGGSAQILPGEWMKEKEECGATKIYQLILDIFFLSKGTGPLPGASGGCVLASLLMVRPAALWHVRGIGARANFAAAAAVSPSQALRMGDQSWARALRQMSGSFRYVREFGRRGDYIFGAFGRRP